MTTEKQIAANRENAKKSTGPRTEDGKRRSRRNAIRHGLTAETVIELYEDVRAYKALQRAISADYRPRTNFELELVARLVSLLWRLRRAVAIERGLLDMHTERRDSKPERSIEIFYNLIPPLAPGVATRADHSDPNEGIRPNRPLVTNTPDSIARSFLRLGGTDGRVFERLGRYEMNVWRQTVQTILLLNSTSCHLNDDVGRYMRPRMEKTLRHVRWPPVRSFTYD